LKNFPQRAYFLIKNGRSHGGVVQHAVGVRPKRSKEERTRQINLEYKVYLERVINAFVFLNISKLQHQEMCATKKLN
jgi:hypothetical protein